MQLADVGLLSATVQGAANDQCTPVLPAWLPGADMAALLQLDAFPVITADMQPDADTEMLQVP